MILSLTNFRTDSIWPVLSADLVSGEKQAVLKHLYTSPPLDQYKFDQGNPYSPLVQVSHCHLFHKQFPVIAIVFSLNNIAALQASSPTGLAVANDELAYVRLTIKNNKRNVQIPLDMKLGLNVTVRWAAPAERFTHAQFGTGEEL
jgi:hypothetical protein